MTTTRVRIDLALVRQVLDHARATNAYAAAKKYDVSRRSVGRWLDRAAANPGWPTDHDIAEWRADEEANGERRRRDAARTYAYRNKVYLNRGPLQRPSIGVTRRVQALYRLGWTQQDMADHMGVSYAWVGHLMNGMWEYVYPSTFDRVDAMYQQLCMTVPVDKPPTHRQQVRVHRRARREAERRGYAPPLAWDEGQIDDPDAQPQDIAIPSTRTARRSRGDVKRPLPDDLDMTRVERVLAGEYDLETSKREKQIIMARWLAAGHSERSLCVRTGWRHGRYTPTTTTTEQQASA